MSAITADNGQANLLRCVKNSSFLKGEREREREIVEGGMEEEDEWIGDMMSYYYMYSLPLYVHVGAPSQVHPT